MVSCREYNLIQIGGAVCIHVDRYRRVAVQLVVLQQIALIRREGVGTFPEILRIRVEHGIPVRAVHNFNRDARSLGLCGRIVEVNGALAELTVIIHGYGDGFGRAGIVSLQRFGIEGLAILSHAVLITADPLIFFIIIADGNGNLSIDLAVIEFHYSRVQRAALIHLHPHGGRFAGQAVAIQLGGGNIAAFAGIDPFLAGIDFLTALVIALHGYGSSLQFLLVVERNRALAQGTIGMHFHPNGAAAIHGIALDPRRGNLFAHALCRIDPLLAALQIIAFLIVALDAHGSRLQRGLFRRQFAGGEIQRIAAGKRFIPVHLNIGGHHDAIHRAGVLRRQLVAKDGVIPLPLRARGHNFQRNAAVQRLRRHSGPVHGLPRIHSGLHKHSLRLIARSIVQVKAGQQAHILRQSRNRQSQL